MSPRISQPGLDKILRDHSADIDALRRGPGRWIAVGTYPGDADTVPESPPFQNGWGNVGSGNAALSFYVDKWRRVHIRGAVQGGAMGSVIFTLPTEYRPESTERFIVAGDDTFAIIQIDPNGDVSRVV